VNARADDRDLLSQIEPAVTPHRSATVESFARAPFAIEAEAEAIAYPQL